MGGSAKDDETRATVRMQRRRQIHSKSAERPEDRLQRSGPDTQPVDEVAVDFVRPAIDVDPDDSQSVFAELTDPCATAAQARRLDQDGVIPARFAVMRDRSDSQPQDRHVPLPAASRQA
jgi:hypothetical protein